MLTLVFLFGVGYAISQTPVPIAALSEMAHFFPVARVGCWLPVFGARASWLLERGPLLFPSKALGHFGAQTSRLKLPPAYTMLTFPLHLAPFLCQDVFHPNAEWNVVLKKEQESTRI